MSSGVCQNEKALGCLGVCMCKNEAEIEDTRILGTVWKVMQNAACSGRSIKISTQEETAEKRFSQQRSSQGAAKSHRE